MRFLNIDHLRYFLVLSQEMHYSRAAQRLNISQSGLSHAIAALEQELGSPCFKKAAGGLPWAGTAPPCSPKPSRL